MDGLLDGDPSASLAVIALRTVIMFMVALEVAQGLLERNGRMTVVRRSAGLPFARCQASTAQGRRPTIEEHDS